jgi:hypothetical protein
MSRKVMDAPPAKVMKHPDPPLPPLTTLGRRERSQLSRGRKEIDARLDLHGMTQERAHRSLAAFLQRPFEYPVNFFGGGSTQSMSAASGFLLFLSGNSLYASVVLLSMGTYVSHLMVYRALKPEFSREMQLRVLWGMNLLPSAVFWSSALLKEPLVMAALGPLVLGLKLVADGRRHLRLDARCRPPHRIVGALVDRAERPAHGGGGPAGGGDRRPRAGARPRRELAHGRGTAGALVRHEEGIGRTDGRLRAARPEGQRLLRP